VSVAAVPRRLIGRLYRRCAAPFGRRALDQMVDDGLPGRLRAPLEFLFAGQAPPEAEAVAERIERRRADIAGQRAAFRFVEHPTSVGMARWPERSDPSADAHLSGRRLANSVSVTRPWGTFLHLCAEECVGVRQNHHCPVQCKQSSRCRTDARRASRHERGASLESHAARRL